MLLETSALVSKMPQERRPMTARMLTRMIAIVSISSAVAGR